MSEEATLYIMLSERTQMFTLCFRYQSFIMQACVSRFIFRVLRFREIPLPGLVSSFAAHSPTSCQPCASSCPWRLPLSAPCTPQFSSGLCHVVFGFLVCSKLSCAGE